MNLLNMYNAQRQLDEHIEQEHPRQLGEDRLLKKKIALLVEIGEMANEWRGFKFWTHKQMNRQKTLEEFVDGIHFFLSLGNEMELKLERINLFKHKTTLECLLDVYETVTTINHGQEYQYHLAFSRFLQLGELMGFTEEEIEHAYYAKNQLNHARQENAY